MPPRRLVASALLLLAACSDSQTLSPHGGPADRNPGAAANEMPADGRTMQQPPAEMDAGVARLPTLDDPGPGMDAGMQVAAPVDLAGRVVRADTGDAVAGAWVTTAAGASEVTDDEGRFMVRSAPEVTVHFDVNASTFAPAHETAPASGPDVRIAVLPWDVTSTFDASREALVEAPQGNAVRIPTNALEDDFAVPQVGTVGIRVAVADLSSELGVHALPGDERERVAFVGAMEITLLKSGVDLRVRQGKALELRFPIHDAQAPTEVGVWSYDTANSRWVPEGTATRQEATSGRAHYRAFASHLSWWAVGTSCEDANADVALCGQCGRPCEPFEGMEPELDAGWDADAGSDAASPMDAASPDAGDDAG